MPQIEVLPNTGSAPTPGWVYVADTGYDPSKAAINPTSGKRSTRYAGAGNSEHLSSRQERARQVRLRELDNDTSAKEISIPPKKKAGLFAGKTTSNTRRILQSAKRFDNYLSDEEAEARNAPTQRVASKVSATDRSRRVSAIRASETPSQHTPAPANAGDASMPPPGPPQAAIFEPLLKTAVPSMPSSEDLEALLAAPPLTYNAARPVLPDQNAPPDPNAPSPRLFCDMCGYWGRIKCMMCGVRICGLECKRDHEDRCNRFG